MKKIAPVDKKSIRQTANPLQTTNPLQRETHFKNKKPETIPEPEVKEPEIEQLKKKLSLIEEKVDAISRLLLELNETRKSRVSPESESSRIEAGDNIENMDVNPENGKSSWKIDHTPEKWVPVCEDGSQSGKMDRDPESWTVKREDGSLSGKLDHAPGKWIVVRKDGSLSGKMEHDPGSWIVKPTDGSLYGKLDRDPGSWNTLRENESQDGNMEHDPGKRDTEPSGVKFSEETGNSLTRSLPEKEKQGAAASDVKKLEKEGLLRFGRLLAAIPPRLRERRVNRKPYLEFVKKYPSIDFPFTQTVRKQVQRYGIEAVEVSERLRDLFISKFNPKEKPNSSMLVSAKILVLLNNETIAPANQFKIKSGINRTSFSRGFNILRRLGFVQSFFTSKLMHYAITEEGKKFLSEDKKL